MQNLKNIPASLLSQQHQETTTTSSCSRSMNRRKSRSPIPSGGTSPLTARALGEEGARGPPPPSLLLSSSSRISPFFTTSGSFSMANSSSSPRTTSAIFGRGGGQQTTLLRHDIIGHDLKQEFRLAFQLFDSRKVGRLSYREMKVKLFTSTLYSRSLFDPSPSSSNRSLSLSFVLCFIVNSPCFSSLGSFLFVFPCPSCIALPDITFFNSCACLFPSQNP